MNKKIMELEDLDIKMESIKVVNDDKNLYDVLVCKCDCLEHQIAVNIDEDNEVWMRFKLNSEVNIFKRIWIAIKYIFGHTSKYGEFDCFEFRKNHIPVLIKIINALEKQ